MRKISGWLVLSGFLLPWLLGFSIMVLKDWRCIIFLALFVLDVIFFVKGVKKEKKKRAEWQSKQRYITVFDFDLFNEKEDDEDAEDYNEDVQDKDDMFEDIRVNDKGSFAKSQKFLCGFDGNFYMRGGKFTTPQKVHDEILAKQRSGAPLTVHERCLLVFAQMFGCCSEKENISNAFVESLLILSDVIGKRPQKNIYQIDDEYAQWLNEYAMAQILLGTIYAYFDEYVKAAYHIMCGLKTNSINLTAPYCDFIKFVLNELQSMPCEDYISSGCGFSAEDPMGSVEGDILIAFCQEMIIEEMEGVNGEVIVAKKGRSGYYGYLRRIGSTSSKTRSNMIDIYETFLIDRNYNLYKIRFYVDGYFCGGIKKIRLAKGFKLITAPQINSRQFRVIG